MSIFDSVAEVDAHIAACKAALLSSPSATKYTVDTGLTSKTFEKNTPKDLREHLIWLKNERNLLLGTSGGGVIHGRPLR